MKMNQIPPIHLLRTVIIQTDFMKVHLPELTAIETQSRIFVKKSAVITFFSIPFTYHRQRTATIANSE